MMALLLSDLHGRARVLEKILHVVGGFDVVVFSGDITDFGNAEKAREILGILTKSGKPVLAVPGNCDPPEVLKALEDAGVSIHGKSKALFKKNFVSTTPARVSIHGKTKTLGGFVFAGFGGSNPTPFDTPFEMQDDVLGAGINSACGGVGNEKVVLITHAPPKNTSLDKLPSGTHVGSEAVRKAIETRQPAFLFCGHVHEGAGTERMGKTLVINPGPALAGHYGLVDLDKNKAELNALGVAK